VCLLSFPKDKCHCTFYIFGQYKIPQGYMVGPAGFY
jgi:hypothetical protein